MSAKVPDDFDQFDATISLQDPIKDYENLLNGKLKVDAIVSNEMMRIIWDKISSGTCEVLWKLMFECDQNNKQNLETAANLLKIFKDDACFYSPWAYNELIVKVRDELLERHMFEFWQDVVVAQELGPAWARDSDLFEDSNDPEPAKFYEFVGCKAPWLKNNNKQIETVVSSPANSASNQSNIAQQLKPLTWETPLQDYKYNMKAQSYIDPDDESAYKKIFADARDIIWQLLFKKAPLNPENFEKAAALLRHYKQDACFYSPYDYNDWIPKVKHELFQNNYMDFWQNVIVQEKLGLCWAQDSDYFDDMEDPKPMVFYKSGENE